MKMIFYKTVHHFFPQFSHWLQMIKEPRNEASITYSSATMIWLGLLLFILKLGSRRQINTHFRGLPFVRNLALLSRQHLMRVPDDDTLGYFLKRLAPSQLYDLRARMIRQLIRNKVLLKYRLYNYYMIVVDGTGYLSFKKRHCAHCLTRCKNGKVIGYYHPVVEAKLVAPNGFVLSVESEFVENEGVGQGPQDCELKAFYRLVERLAVRYPQLRICLLLDGLYANEKVFDICEKNGWKYIIVFKEGSLAETYVEYESLKRRCVDNQGVYETESEKQQYQWVEGINYKFKDRYYVNVLECLATDKKTAKKTRYLWLTNFKIDKHNYYYLANKGGRLRWKIENEGFNMQKNGGYNLEHPYSYDCVAMKNIYLLIQIAHIINQLIEKGSLLTAVARRSLGSIRSIAQRLLEDLRTSIFNTKEIQKVFTQRFQIRFNTS